MDTPNLNLRKKSVLVVGAGISGLLAAKELQAKGFNVAVIDKGRGLGGRMATRRLEAEGLQGKADHGAQYITGYTPRFISLLEEMIANNVLRAWTNTKSESQEKITKKQRFIAPEGMTAVAKYLAQGLNIRLGERVVSLSQEPEYRTWKAHTDKGEILSADVLLLTSPVPQSLMLLDTLSETLPESILTDSERRNLEAVEYLPCIALMIALKAGAEPRLGEIAMHFVGTKEVMWIADNTRKGISPNLRTLTIHTQPSFAAEHWETREEELIPLLLSASAEYVSQSHIAAYSLHRWRYSRVSKPFSELFFHATLPKSPLLFAGDAFTPEIGMVTRIEDAAISGWSAAEYLYGLEGF